MTGGLPARFSNVTINGVALPLTETVALNVPGVSFAVKRGELARPRAPVVSVASLEPPTKLAPALAEAAPAPLPPALEPSVKVTDAPCTGFPAASSTSTCSGLP